MESRIFKYFNRKLLGEKISFFHEFRPAPYGGSNSFFIALKGYLESRGILVDVNLVKRNTEVVLLNAFLFDEKKLENYKNRYPDIKIIHRIDGPVSAHRAIELDIDRQLLELNTKFADRTIIQSEYSKKKSEDLGLFFKNPVVIHNAANPLFFNRNDKSKFNKDKVKIIASSWSDNRKKGAEVYRWLENELDWSVYEFTFVGRLPIKLKRAKHIDACPPEELSRYLKNSDIYITASENDSCSNSLIEALSCGLPAIYLNSGGHPEIVKNAGIGFSKNEEIIGALDKIRQNYYFYQNNIEVLGMEQVAKKYLDVMFQE